jgi:UDP-N-acetylmuramate dehydrogenase
MSTHRNGSPPAALAVRSRVPLAGFTTLGVGGPAERLVEAGADEEVIAAIRDADRDGDPLLVLGGGSNLVVADAGFAGTVLRIASRGIAIRPDGPGALVTVAAGEDWDPLVARCVADGMSGLECLSGIPGLAGATPIQNVGAYGQEVAQTLVSVRAYDRRREAVTDLPAAGCGFGYRTSAFKRAASQAAAPTGPQVILGVTFRLERTPLSAPLRYPELAARLGAPAGGRVPLPAVRDAVLGLRRAKGMVLDPADPDSRSAGSFFTNPVLDPAAIAGLERAAAARAGRPVRVPRFAAEDGRVKVPAAWLIEQAGFGRGHPAGAAARISAKHTLALTNRGGASAADLIALARQLRDGVRAAFGVELASEPVLVGLTL